MKPSKMLELVENLKVGEKVIIEKFKDHLFVEKKSSGINIFKDGDILYGAKTNEYSVENISIYRDEETTYFHWNMTDDSIRHWAVPCAINSVLATEDQKQLLFDRLAKDGKRWNAETKQLEDIYISPYQGLFELMIQEHDLILTESEMTDIIHEVQKIGVDKIEDLNEPEIGDDVIVWDEPRNQDALITRMTTDSPFIWDMVVRWDGTKEQFDRVREGCNK